MEPFCDEFGSSTPKTCKLYAAQNELQNRVEVIILSLLLDKMKRLFAAFVVWKLYQDKWIESGKPRCFQLDCDKILPQRHFKVAKSMFPQGTHAPINLDGYLDICPNIVANISQPLLNFHLVQASSFATRRNGLIAYKWACVRYFLGPLSSLRHHHS